MQIELIQAGSTISKETRTFDVTAGVTRRMRSKASAKDYRFFPEPDLPPLILSQRHIESLKASLPELPDALQQRLVDQYGLSQYESQILVQGVGAADYFLQVASKPSRPHKTVANWVMNDLFGLLKATNTDIVHSPVDAQRLGELIDLVIDKAISGKIAKDVLKRLYYEDSRPPLDIIEEMGLRQISDADAIEQFCRRVVHSPVCWTLCDNTDQCRSTVSSSRRTRKATSVYLDTLLVK